VLSLTFDDGPDPRWTSRVLDALDRCGARATFFMVGVRILAAPAAARAVLAAGHEVQLHCHRHVRHTDLDEAEIERDTRAALAVLAGIGVRPTQWRTPWGVETAASARVARAHGLSLVRWTLDTHDWRGDRPEAMLANARPLLVDGDVVLMHDALGPGALRGDCENTVELVEGLVTAARNEGIGVGPLSLRSWGAGAPASQAPQVHQLAGGGS
jgi:peptidoglycan/xylan/chitin deacetylase (PgdA/CDA1 family)